MYPAAFASYSSPSHRPFVAPPLLSQAAAAAAKTHQLAFARRQVRVRKKEEAAAAAEAAAAPGPSGAPKNHATRNVQRFAAEFNSRLPNCLCMVRPLSLGTTLLYIFTVPTP